MEIIRQTRDQDTGIAARREAPWVPAIRDRYGEFPEFMARFTPNAQKFCASNIRKAVEEDMPVYGQIVIAYGEAATARLIATHMTDAILRMGEEQDLDSHDIRFIAEAICEGERFRKLRFPSVFAFFHLLKCGEFDIYGKVTPRKILEAFRKYAIEQYAREERMASERDKGRQEEERQRWEREGVSWNEWALSRGIAGQDFDSWRGWPPNKNNPNDPYSTKRA